MAVNVTSRERLSGIEFDVLRGGEGPTLLFLHPGTGIRDHDAFLERLASQYSVVAPSHPGFDGSDLPKSFTSVDDLAYFYLDFIQAHRLSDIILVGASLGAWIAAGIAIKSPSLFSALVLIGPVGAKFQGEREREIADLFSIPSYEQDRLLFHGQELAERTYADLDKPSLLTMARNFESFARLGWSPTLFDPKLRQRLPRLTMPTLIMRGDNDQVVSTPYCRAFCDAIPGAGYEQIAQAGHYAHIEQVEYVASRISEMTARRSSSPPPRDATSSGTGPRA